MTPRQYPGVAENQPETFGCDRCYDGDAEQVWEGRPLVVEREVVPGSHFSVDLARCSHCGQLYVRVYHEWVDYARGKDDQYWDVLPVTQDEAERIASGADLVHIRRLGRGRRRLCFAWPRDVERPESYWASGEFVIHPH